MTYTMYARVAKLADALGLGPSPLTGVGVRVLSLAFFAKAKNAWHRQTG